MAELASQSLAEAASLFHAFWGRVTLDGAPVASRTITQDATILGVFAIYSAVLFAANWGIRFAIAPVARLLLGSGGKRVKESKVDKFCQSFIEAVYYGVFSYVGVVLVMQRPRPGVLWPSVNWWYERDGTVRIDDDLVCFYILYCARYIQNSVSVLLEHKRKDFGEMITHHVVTAVLVWLSYFHDFLYVGIVVMVIFDPADVPLHVAKLCKYTGEAHGAGTRTHKTFQFLADRFFELFAVSFFVMRLMMFPYCIYSAQFEAPSLGVGGNICVGLMYILLVLQVMWMYLILKAVYNMILKGGIEVCTRAVPRLSSFMWQYVGCCWVLVFFATFCNATATQDVRSDSDTDGEEVEPKKAR